MKSKSCLFYLFFIVLANVSAQSVVSRYNWEDNPTVFKTDSAEHPGLIYKIFDRATREIYITDDGKGNFYESTHIRYKILTEGGMDVYNKVELSLYDVDEIIKLNARTIKPNGEVSVLPQSAIKHVTNYNESGVDYKIFVFEGLEIGSEVEYIFTCKKEPSLYGYSLLQWNVDAGVEELKLIYPSHLDYRIKTYGEGVVHESDTVYNGSRKYIHNLYYVPNAKGLAKEPFANWKSHLARVDYVLDKNRLTSNYEMNSYKLLAQTYYESVYPSDPKPNKKAVTLVKKITGNESDRTRIAQKIENYVKENFKSAESPGDKDVNRIIGTFKGNTRDKCTAFIELYRAAGFKVELVFTADNSSRIFDPEFETPNNCNELLIYLPEIKYYMSPESFGLKSGYCDMSVFEQKGMFVKQVCVGDFCSGVHYISTIPANKADDSVHDMNFEINFNTDMTGNMIKFENSMTGYHAANYQPIYGFIDQDGQDKLKKVLVEGFIGDYKGDVEVLNGSYDVAFDKPFIIKGDVTTESLMENAGDKYLFKLGFLLGEQFEMYDNLKRQLPIENDFNRMYTRTIKVNIPDGYQVSNTQDFKNTEIICEYKGEKAAGITFNYELTDNQLLVKIIEDYTVLNLPIEEYDKYREVINASADFNKKMVVLTKK